MLGTSIPIIFINQLFVLKRHNVYPNKVIITGVSRGLGKALTQSLPESIKVLGISRKFPDFYRANTEYLLQDISEYEKTEKSVSAYADYNILPTDKVAIVLCAATLGISRLLSTSYLKDWEDVYKTNVLGNLAVIKALIPQMKVSQFGRIVLLAGGGAAYGYPVFSAYALSKVAIVREAENLDMELSSLISDFSVIALAPGAINTDMLKEVLESGAEVKTTVDINEPVNFIKTFISMEKLQAHPLSGQFLHVRDDYVKNAGERLLRRT